jgi:hypothetical protein
VNSNSGRPGGTFCVHTCATGRRVEVEDGAWGTARGVGNGQSRRGLVIVSNLASRWGTTGGGARRRIVWFEIDCP